MTRRCSHCSHNGHNSRTCPNRGVKLFGVRLTDGSIRKSASMGNLTHYAGSGSGSHHAASNNNPGSPGGDTPDRADGYASEDFVPGSSSTSRERKKGSILRPKNTKKEFFFGLSVVFFNCMPSLDFDLVSFLLLFCWYSCGNE